MSIFVTYLLLILWIGFVEPVHTVCPARPAFRALPAGVGRVSRFRSLGDIPSSVAIILP
jgi:hypothetical protein